MFAETSLRFPVLLWKPKLLHRSHLLGLSRVVDVVMIFTGKQTACRGNMCAVCNCQCASASREAPVVFWQRADKAAFAGRVLLTKLFLWWQILWRKAVLPAQLDHRGGLFSTVFNTSASLSLPRAPCSSVPMSLRLSIAFPRGQGLSMVLASCKTASCCGEPTAATAKRQDRMRRVLVACRAGSQGWAADCRFSLFRCWRHYGNVPRHLQHVSDVGLLLWGCCLSVSDKKLGAEDTCLHAQVVWAVTDPSPAHSPACMHLYGARCSVIFCPTEQIWDPGQHLPLTEVTGETELGRPLQEQHW